MRVKVVIIGADTPSESILQRLDERFGSDGYDIIDESELPHNPYTPTMIDDTLIFNKLNDCYFESLPKDIIPEPHIHRATPLPKRLFDRNMRPKSTHSNRKFYR